MSGVADQVELHLKNYERLSRNGASDSPEWVRHLRQTGIERFAEQGFPTTRQEEWRFTNVSAIAGFPSTPVKALSGAVRVDQLRSVAMAELHGPQLVFVNGYHVPEMSTPAVTPAGVVVTSLSAAMLTHAELVEQHLGQYAVLDDRPFVALSTAFVGDGAFIHVPRGVTVEEPIYLLYLFAAAEPGATAHPRNLIVAEDSSRVTIIEHYASLIEETHFTNAVTEIVAGDDATVEHIKVQNENRQAFHVGTIQGHVGRNARFTSHNTELGARLSRNDVNVVLDGEGIECTLNGLYIVKGQQHVDNHTFLDHAKSHCDSHELYRGILDGNSTGVFRGKIRVWEGAQKTDAKQTNNNLLLSDEATVDTMPQLEIFADDVKCTHGATVGQLDDDAIFYLRSRGIDAESARTILTRAFAGAIINRISNEPVKEHLDDLLGSLLSSHL